MNIDVKCMYCKTTHAGITATEAWFDSGQRVAKWKCPVKGFDGVTLLQGGRREPTAAWKAAAPERAKKAADTRARNAAAAAAGGEPTKTTKATTKAAPKPPVVNVDTGAGNDTVNLIVGDHAAPNPAPTTTTPARKRGRRSPAPTAGEGNVTDARSHTLRFERIVSRDFDPRAIFPFVIAVLRGLQRKGLGGEQVATAIARADAMYAEAMGLAKPPKRGDLDDVGDDFADAIADALIALRITPDMWVMMYSRRAAAAFANGEAYPMPQLLGGDKPAAPVARLGAGGLPNVDDLLAGAQVPAAGGAVEVNGSGNPTTQESGTLDAAERLAMAGTGATIGAGYGGKKGAVIGGALGLLSPEIDRVAGWALGQLGFDWNGTGGGQAAPQPQTTQPVQSAGQEGPDLWSGRRRYTPAVEEVNP